MRNEGEVQPAIRLMCQCDSAAERVAVLGDRAGQDRETDLAVVVDGDDANNGLSEAASRAVHRSW